MSAAKVQMHMWVMCRKEEEEEETEITLEKGYSYNLIDKPFNSRMIMKFFKELEYFLQI